MADAYLCTCGFYAGNFTGCPVHDRVVATAGREHCCMFGKNNRKKRATREVRLRKSYEALMREVRGLEDDVVAQDPAVAHGDVGEILGGEGLALVETERGDDNRRIDQRISGVGDEHRLGGRFCVLLHWADVEGKGRHASSHRILQRVKLQTACRRSGGRVERSPGCPV